MLSFGLSLLSFTRPSSSSDPVQAVGATTVITEPNSRSHTKLPAESPRKGTRSNENLKLSPHRTVLCHARWRITQCADPLCQLSSTQLHAGRHIRCRDE